MRVGREVLGVLERVPYIECKREGGTVSGLARSEIGAGFLKIEVLLAVEGAGERSSRSSSSSEKAWFETDSSSAPADEEPETEDEH